MLYAGDLNAIQSLAAALSDFTQIIQASTFEIGDDTIQLSKLGSGVAGLSSALTINGLFSGLGGFVSGAYTTTQMNAIVNPPYGMIILNTTENIYMWQTASTGSPVWQALAPSVASSSIGTLSQQPAASSVEAGSSFFATDQVVSYISDGISNWYRQGLPAGATLDWFSNIGTPTGWVVLDGTALPESTGIYAALYAAQGNSLTKADTRDRAVYGVGTASGRNAPGDNDGLTVADRGPIHNHTFTKPSASSSAPSASASTTVSATDTGHSHTLQGYDEGGDSTFNYPGGQTNSYPNADFGGTPIITGYANIEASASTSVSVSAPTITVTGGSVGPGGSIPTDGPAWITAYKIAKL